MRINLLLVLGLSVAFLAGYTISRIDVLFIKADKVTGVASVQLLVVLTTAMLVIRFLLDFFGPWYNTTMSGIIVTIETLNYSLVHYTLGLMQLSAAKVNDYFQVWAVLLVTLQYSVKIGRPYSRSKQIPLLDLMSSLWAANLIRVQTFLLLRIPLWLIWAVNAARIISYFAFSDKAEAINQESMKLVADYMRYEHKLHSRQDSADATDRSKAFTMKWYKYLVHGEHEALKDLQEWFHPAAADHKAPTTEQVPRWKQGISLDPNNNEKLVTIDKIWGAYHDDSNHGGLPGSDHHLIRDRDVCLSFSLYKQLRRRFHDLPTHEARLGEKMKKMRRLVLEYILHDAERAFRVAATELSFLQDLFYSKHAAIFATRFPRHNLVLSVLLVAATGYIAYPVRYIPVRMDRADRNTITHGVFVTRVIIALIIGKELAEVYMYVFSPWTKVLILCSYTTTKRRRRLGTAAMRAVLRLMRSGGWNETIRQRNLLISCRAVRVPWLTIVFPNNFPGGIKLKACTKEAIFKALKKKLEETEAAETGESKTKQQLGCSYFSDAFGAGPEELLQGRLGQEVANLVADTHRILVWHIATSLCEIRLASHKASELSPFRLLQRPFVQEPAGLAGDDDGNNDEAAADVQWWGHYTTAASLSNYCAYLVTQSLVPDNGLVAVKVLEQVCEEILHVTINDGSIRSLLRWRPKLRSMKDVHDRLMETVRRRAQTQSSSDVEMADHARRRQRRGSDDDGMRIDDSLTRIGAELAGELVAKYGEDDKKRLWEKLAAFWTGFLLHLAASTRASKHKTCLAGRQELATHLWALLSHAGLVHGGHDELLDPEDLEKANQTLLAADGQS
ncbi:hypothetical protein BS78_K288100 [Paspalum vaginatum]|uniref:DUF4220 domain-containing protein n=1 Tax=Paspalum vaginatum TaxID=158149 RepID=A0A9W7XBB9_9POAL|nr:hypothetical protein BS78_K288100 [Paspalum vaginatum]